MNLETSLAVYAIFWWVVLFSVLPMGVVSHAEAGLRTPGGGDPAAPVDPQLKRKFLTTTWVSALLFAPFWLAVHFHWISLGMLRGG
jgi:predicted secreted protein